MQILVLASLASMLFASAGEEWAPSLKGSKASLRRQNAHADFEKLVRIDNERQLAQLKQSGYLVEIRETPYLIKKPDRRWKQQFHWLRPNAATFLDDVGAMFYSIFSVPLQVNSAVRTKAHQRAISRTNYNAAPVDGDRASPHLTGAALDIAKLPLNAEQRTFLRHYLLDLEERGFIEVSEEHNQAVFHIMVFSAYEARTAAIVMADAPLSGN